MTVHPTAIPLPPSAFSSRAPSRVVPPTHLPLPPSQFPLLHSLLDSPEYRQTVEKQPELFHRPSFNHNGSSSSRSASQQRSHSLDRASSTRRPLRTPSSIVNTAWKKTRGASRAQGTPLSQVSPIRQPSVLREGGGGGGRGANHPDLRRPTPMRSVSSQVGIPNLSVAAQPPSKTSPQPFANLAKVSPPAHESNSALPEPIRNGTEAPHLRERQAIDPSSSQFSSTTTSSFQSLPNLSQATPARERHSLPPPSSYPSRRREPSSDCSPTRSKPSSSFTEAISQLKRMLSARPLERSTSKSSLTSSRRPSLGNTRSRSESTLNTLGTKDSNGKTVLKPTHRNGAAQTGVQRYKPPSLGSAYYFLSPLKSSKSPPIVTSPVKPNRESHKRPTKPLFEARPPLDSRTSDLPGYLESRRQLLQLLREGPGSDAARSSSVLQATIRSARDGGGNRSKSKVGKFNWLGSIKGMRRRKVEEWGDEERGIGQAERRVRKKSLKSQKSSISNFQSRELPSRPQSYHGKKISACTSVDSLGFVDLATSTSLNLEEARGTTAYSSYGARWENGRRMRPEDDISDEDKVWSQWKKWVRERRDYLQGNNQ